MGASTVIAIDGPAGSGKSTLARRLAEVLELAYVNTGLMYRALALRAIREGVQADDADALARLAARIGFDLDHSVRPASLVIDGSPPDRELSSAEVESSVSRVSGHPEVRGILRDAQRRLASTGAVVEGRDIGTVVVPDAGLKLYLEARPDERIARRARERDARSGRVARSLSERDALDARTNPLEPATDAVLIDTTEMDADAVLRTALALVRDRLGLGS